jgi:hypothetical protein
VTGSKNTHFNNVQINFSDEAQKIYWENWRREIIWDKDGSLSNTPGGAYIVPFKTHLQGIDGCVDMLNPSVDRWDNS